MAYSYVQYTGNAATVAFSIPFQYLSAGYLEVRLGGVLTTAYTLPSANILQMNVAPGNGVILEIRRNTPKTSRLVDFQDASILTEASLDLDSDQSFHVAQEALDASEASIRLTANNVYDALSKKIINVADPVNAQDAATKYWCENGLTAPLTQAAASASAAAVSAGQSQTYANSSFLDSMNAIDSAGAAAISASDANGYRAAAVIAKNSAEAAAVAADADRVAAAASAASASASAATCTSLAVDAVAVHADATSAAASAASAAADAASTQQAALVVLGDVIGVEAAFAPSNAMLGSAAYQDAEQMISRVFPVAKSAAYTVTANDNGKTLVVSGTTTITLPPAADVYNTANPFSITIKAVTAAVVTVARSGSDTIETVAGNKSMTANTALVFFPTSTSAWETI